MSANPRVSRAGRRRLQPGRVADHRAAVERRAEARAPQADRERAGRAGHDLTCARLRRDAEDDADAARAPRVAHAHGRGLLGVDRDVLGDDRARAGRDLEVVHARRQRDGRLVAGRDVARAVDRERAVRVAVEEHVQRAAAIAVRLVRHRDPRAGVRGHVPHEARAAVLRDRDVVLADVEHDRAAEPLGGIGVDLDDRGLGQRRQRRDRGQRRQPLLERVGGRGDVGGRRVRAGADAREQHDRARVAAGGAPRDDRVDAVGRVAGRLPAVLEHVGRRGVAAGGEQHARVVVGVGAGDACARDHDRHRERAPHRSSPTDACTTDDSRKKKPLDTLPSAFVTSCA